MISSCKIYRTMLDGRHKLTDGYLRIESGAVNERVRGKSGWPTINFRFELICLIVVFLC